MPNIKFNSIFLTHKGDLINQLIITDSSSIKSFRPTNRFGLDGILVELNNNLEYFTPSEIIVIIT